MKIKKFFNNFFADNTRKHAPDYMFLVIVGIIVIFGLIMLSSATSVYAYASRGGNNYYFFKNQLFAVFIGLIGFFLAFKIDYRVLRKYALGFLIISIIFLLLVFIPGLSANYGKARSWINIFGFSLQPSELVKVSFLLYLAAWLEARRDRLKNIKEGIGPFLIVLGVVGFLMLLQPDLGTLSIIFLTSIIVYYVGGGSLRHIFIIMLVAFFIFIMLIKLKPYQADRFRCFYNPDYSANDICYQINQSLIAVGSGGVWGRGLGESRQKFMYIPEVSGDAIYPIIAEETGFIFASGLIILYILFFYRGYKIAKNAPDYFGQNLSIGIVIWITLQAIINIGGMINFMPMTGVPLPFVSYGGTAMIAVLTAVGVLANISRQTIK